MAREHADDIAQGFVALVRDSTLAVGVVNLDADTTSDHDVLVAADIAMYEAKGAGGDRICVGGPARPLS